MGTLTLQVPVMGQLDSTEEAKLVSDMTAIQTWANGSVDLSNLAAGVGRPSYVSATTSRAATDGQALIAYPGTTITLTPGAGAVITVFAHVTVTGASPVTVTTGTGAIFGLGAITSVTSILLGTPGSSATFYCGDGMNWAIIAGQHDTGWVKMTLDPSINTTVGSYDPAIRRQGDMIQLRGGAVNNTGANKSGNWATVPAGIRPAAQVVVPVAFSASVTGGGLVVSTAGGLGSPAIVPNGVSLYFDGIAYSAL